MSKLTKEIGNYPRQPLIAYIKEPEIAENVWPKKNSFSPILKPYEYERLNHA